MRIKAMILAAIVGAILTGCFFSVEEPYQFRQDFEEIIAIEILKKEYDSIRVDTPMDVIKTIAPEDHRELIDGLLEVEGGRTGLEPGTGFGMYIIRISYRDGEQEMIGNYNNGYISPEGIIHEDGYSFDTEQYYNLISRFIGEKIIDYTYS